MGHYLKQQYEERDLAKALAKVHGLIDSDYQKLSDKYQDLKLSHNRMVKLLKMSLKLLDDIFSHRDSYKAYSDAFYLYNLIKQELNCPVYRVRERKKGGKNAFEIKS